MIFSLPEYTQRLRLDLRKATIYNETLKRVHLDHKQKIEELTKKNKQIKKELDKFKKENEKLKQEIEKLTKTNSRYKVSLFDHGNFKSPDLENNKRANGGQAGHLNTNKDTQRDYSSFPRKRIYAKNCGRCGENLSRANGLKEKVLIDIVINTKTLQMIIQSERQWCRKCHIEVRVTHPQSLPFSEYGINTFMTVMYLRFKDKQSFLTIAATLNSLFGLSISKSGVGTLLKQAKKYLKDKYEELKKTIRNGEIMYNDETGWSVRGKSAWMWIMTNKDTTVYIAAESRGKGIMEEMYGNSCSYSMHDGYAGYTNTVPEDKQLYCWSHILRFVYEETILETKDSIAHSLKERLVHLYQTIRSHPQWTRKRKEQLLEKEFNEILLTPRDSQAINNILHRLKAQKAGLIRALLVTEDGTNNLAERELRPLAICRNISFGSDTYQGMETTAILASVVQTIARNKTQEFFPTLQSYLYKGIRKKYPQYKHIPIFAT